MGRQTSVMAGEGADSEAMQGPKPFAESEKLTLDSRLADLVRVWPWVESIASRHRIPADTAFAINLCLEEALSNIVRHGYGGAAGHAITIEFFLVEGGDLDFVVEDDAPPFSPLEDAPEIGRPAATTLEEIRPGGLGIGLLRRFAARLSYERLRGRNRLRIGFPGGNEGQA